MATPYKKFVQTGQVLLKIEHFYYSMSIYLTGLWIFLFCIFSYYMYEPSIGQISKHFLCFYVILI